MNDGAQADEKGLPTREVLEAYARALDREAHVLAEYPDLTWQQLHNRLQWEGDAVEERLALTRDRRSVVGARPWFRTRTPLRQSPALVRVLTGHTGTVNVAAFSPDGRRIVSRGADGMVRVWDPESGACLRVFEAGLLALRPGLFVVSTGDDKSVCLWDAGGAAEVRTLQMHGAFSPDGRWVGSIGAHEGWPGLVHAVSPDGRLIVKGEDQDLFVWDAESGRRLRTLRNHQLTGTETYECSFSPDGALVVTAGGGRTAGEPYPGYRWEDEHGPEHRIGHLMLWNLQAEESHELSGHGHNGYVYACAFSPDGRWIVSCGEDGMVKVWDTGRRVCSRTLEGHAGTVRDCAFSPDGRWIVSCGEDSTVKVWDMEIEADLDPLRARDAADRARQIRSANSWSRTTFSPDGHRIVSEWANYDIGVFEMMATAVTVWDWETGEEVRSLAEDVLVDVAEYPTWAFREDGRRIVSVAEDAQSLKVWDTGNGAEATSIEGHEQGVWDCAFSLDGSRIVSVGKDHTFKVWGAESGALLRALDGPAGTLRAWDLSPDARRIVSATKPASEDETLKLVESLVGPDPRIDRPLLVWDAERGGSPRALEGHEGYVYACRFSPDGRWIVSAGEDGTVRVWETETGVELCTLDRQAEGVTGFAFTPDGQRIVCSRDDGTVMMWDARSGKEVRPPAGLTGQLSAFAITPDGHWIISARGDPTGGILGLWDGATDEMVAVLPLPHGLVSVDVHPRGWMACRGADGCLHRAELVGVEFGPLFVTALDFGEGPVIVCPLCRVAWPLEPALLGQAMDCPGETCPGRLSVTPSPAEGRGETTPPCSERASSSRRR